MKKGNIIVMFTVLVLGCFILYYMASFSNGSIRPYPTTEIELTTNQNILSLTNTDLQNNNFIKIETDNLIKFSLNEKEHEFEIKGINKEDNLISMGHNKEIILLLEIPSSKKLNLNFDETYELQVSTRYSNNNEIEIAFKPLDEKMNIVESIDSKIENSFLEFEKAYNLQLKIIMWLLTIMIILILIYLIKVIFIPEFKLKRKKDSEKPHEALDYLLSEIEKLKQNNQKDKVKKLLTRAKNLYKYLPKDSKQRFKSRIDLMENFVRS